MQDFPTRVADVSENGLVDPPRGLVRQAEELVQAVMDDLGILHHVDKCLLLPAEGGAMLTSWIRF